jgi:hypothetical protein
VFAVGTKVELLSPLAGHPAGTSCTVLATHRDGTCEVEFASGSQLLIDCNALRIVRARPA